MAQKVPIPGGASLAKIRNPWGVIGLSIITLGFYYVFWWYFVNREMRDLGDGRAVDLGSRPGVSVLAITFGWFLIIPPFVSIWRTGGRMERTQQAVGVGGGSAALFFLLHLVPFVSLFAPLYFQSELNKAWRALAADL